jgi:hypothetical protein
MLVTTTFSGFSNMGWFVLFIHGSLPVDGLVIGMTQHMRCYKSFIKFALSCYNFYSRLVILDEKLPLI